MDKKKIFYITAAAVLIYLIMATTKVFGKITQKNEMRGADKWGSGAFGASRGGRQHNGVDIVVYPGQDIKAPISGKITRHAIAYANDPDFKGLVIENDRYQVKMLYLNPSYQPGTTVTKGAVIATAQNIASKYPGMVPHVHFEVLDKQTNKIIDPTKMFE